MAFTRDASRRHPTGTSADDRALRAGYGPDSDDWIEPTAPPRDMKKAILVLGLGTLSWVATYVGMLELIEANMGVLPLTHKLIIGFSVAMLMIMIIWLLDQLFSPINFTTKVIYAAGYLFLTLISVGFGFGFYWKVLESRSEATRSAESAVSEVQNALHAGSTRLEQLNATLQQLTQLSAAKAVEEREKGTTCPNSRPGDGPRRQLRDDDAQRFAFAAELVGARISTVRGDLTSLDQEIVRISATDGSTTDESGTRNEFMRNLNRRLDLTVTGFNAFRSDPQLRQIRTDLAERAERTVFPAPRGGTFACPDPQLQAALRGVVRAIDQLPELRKPQIAAVEGSEATIEAFRRLTATLYGAMVLDLPPSAEELRQLQKKAIQSVSSGSAPAAPAANEPVGLSKRDYIPLAIAIFVDLCLLLVSIGRPMNRLNNLVPLMREAERGPMVRILSRFNEIHRDPEIRQNFEVFRHVVFDMHGAYYVAVPLDAPYRPTVRGSQGGFGFGSQDAQDLQHEAHLLANLFTGFEQQKIFSRVYNPLLTTKAIQKKLWRQGSKFAGCQAFRVYRFRDGEWSNMILQAVMGAAKRAEEDKRRRRHLEDEVEARVTAAVEARLAEAVEAKLAAAVEAEARSRSLRGEAGPSGRPAPELSIAPDVPRKGFFGWRNGASRNGAARSEPAQAGEAAATTAAAGGEAYANGSSLNGAPGKPVNGRLANGSTVNGSPVNGSTVSGTHGPNGAGSRRTAEIRLDSPAASDPALEQAFGRYARRAAAELIETDLDEIGGDGFDADTGRGDARGPDRPAMPVEAANTNTAVSARATGPEARRSGERMPELIRDPGPSDLRTGPGSGSALARSDVVVPMPQPRRYTSMAAPASGLAHAVDHAIDDDARTVVTLTRETATYTVPVSEAQLPLRLMAAANGGRATALRIEPKAELRTEPPASGIPEITVEPTPAIAAAVEVSVAPEATTAAWSAPVSPPPLPAWARPDAHVAPAIAAQPVEPASKAQDAVLVPEDEAVDPQLDEVVPAPAEAVHEWTANEPDTSSAVVRNRFDLEPDPFADEDDRLDDEAVVTIASRLRPQTEPRS